MALARSLASTLGIVVFSPCRRSTPVRLIIKKIVIPMALLCAGLMSACSGPSTAPVSSGAEKPSRTKEQMVELGRQHKTAAELYRALRDEAKGGQRLTATTVPDWSGVYTRQPVPGFAFDADQPAD